MDKIFTQESLHDLYWKEMKSKLEELENSPRICIALEWIKKLQPRVVLDIGCGLGYLAKLIKRDSSKIEVDGFDLSSVAIEHAKQYLNRCWKLNIDVADVPISDETYDAIVCLEVTEHVYDVYHLLDEIKRILKNSGRALISVPNLAYWRYRLQLLIGQLPHPEVTDERHLHMFTLASIKERLFSIGLQMKRVWGYGERVRPLVNLYPGLLSSTLFVEVCRLNKKA